MTRYTHFALFLMSNLIATLRANAPYAIRELLFKGIKIKEMGLTEGKSYFVVGNWT